ncbi:hypothetical protein FMM56_04595 [Campylobacter sp. LR264d]|uniref:hypothetical protein n=1 Tax=Campylobacter sp. LR264d TaxID=2593544 RepID=UPI00123927D5|nr:hypothetical protein [Campylobacter sp. LR264d]KAA6231430.1 hypothetical protein FMM56_04595 [Campylobacter sp. LR264d]
MLDYKKLQEMDLKEVANKTQIEFAFLKAVVNHDFELAHRFNVYGFVKILSKEYDLDFTNFLEQYDKYLEDNNLKQETQIKPNKTVAPRLDSYSQKSSNLFPVIIFLIVIILAGGGYYYFDEIKAFFTSKNNVASNMVSNIIDQAKTNLKNLSTTNEKDELKEAKAEKKKEDVVVVNIQEANVSTEETNSTQIATLPTQNTQTPTQAIENTNNTSVTETTQISSKQSSESTENSVNEGVVLFKPKTKIWIGTIDLKTYRKTNLVKEEDFELPLNKDQLILTGASALDIIDNSGNTQSFPAGASKRFLIRDGNISSISLGEFLRLNKGREW